MKVLYPLHMVIVLMLLTVGLMVLLITGCSRQYVMTERGTQAYYQTGFPIDDTSRDLERIFRSVKRINVTVHYNTFIFNPDRRITLQDIETYNLSDIADERLSATDSKAGTAIVIASNPLQTALITNEHVVDYPDTLIEYYKTPDGKRTRYIQQISVKVQQVNLIYDLPELGAFDIIVRDERNDIAIIGVRHPDTKSSSGASVLRVPPGNPERLSWGSFVYVLGYPKGHKMVTRGIISNPGRGRDSSFLLDALFNRGVSGGLILAIRGETGEMEWIGMARSGSASTEMILAPRDAHPDEADLFRPFEGDIFLKPDSRIEYGITFPISIKTIQSFLSQHRELLEQKGYSVSRYLGNN